MMSEATEPPRCVWSSASPSSTTSPTLAFAPWVSTTSASPTEEVSTRPLAGGALDNVRRGDTAPTGDMSGTYKYTRRDREVAADVAAIHARLAALAQGPMDEHVADELSAIRAHLQQIADSNAAVGAGVAEAIDR